MSNFWGAYHYVVLTEVFTRIYVIWTVVKWKSCLGYLYDD